MNNENGKEKIESCLGVILGGFLFDGKPTPR